MATLVATNRKRPTAGWRFPTFWKGTSTSRGTYLRKEPGHFVRLGIEIFHRRVERVEAETDRIHLDSGET